MVLKFENVHKIYESGTHALNNINLEIAEGEFVVVIGSSGAGKSTLLRCINRLTEPTMGEIEFLGHNVTHVQGKNLRQVRRQIGFIFQQFNLNKRSSVLTNVLNGKLGALGTLDSILRNFSDKTYADAYRWMKLVGIEEKAKVRVDMLSGGQQQRVAIARSLMQNPKLLIADEPVASLDPVTSLSVMQYFEEINRELKTTIICNLHNVDLARRFATRVLALKRGEVVYDGLPDTIDDVWLRKIYRDETALGMS